MKTVIKVFLYIIIVLYSILAGILLIGCFVALPVSLICFLYVAICAVPIVVDSIALKKLANAYTKSELTAISICVLIFGGIIPGILMLVASEEDLFGYKKSSVTIVKQTEKKEFLGTKLEKIKKLKDSGTISEEEYLELRKKIIDNFKGE